MPQHNYIKRYETTKLLQELVFRSGIRNGQITITIFSDGKQFNVEQSERFRSGEDMQHLDSKTKAKEEDTQ